MKYLTGNFSVLVGGNDNYRERYAQIDWADDGRQRDPNWPTCPACGLALRWSKPHGPDTSSNTLTCGCVNVGP